MALLPDQPPTPDSAATAAWPALLDLATDLMAVLDAQGRILWANTAFQRLSGHEGNAAIGQAYVTLLGASEDWGAVATRLATGQNLPPTELTWRHASGSLRRGRLSARALPPEQPGAPPHLAVTLQDITEATQLSAETQHQAELLDMAQEFGRLGIWERVIPSGEGHWDRHVFRFFGLDPAEGTPSFDAVTHLVHPDDRDGVAYRESTRRAGRYAHHFRIVRTDGEVRHVHSQWEVKNSPQGVPDRVIGLMLDDTEAYRLADAIHKANAQLQIAVDLAHIAVWRHDLKLNRIFYNDHAFQILGIPPEPEGLTLDRVRSMIHPEDMPLVMAAAEQSLRTEDPVDMEARYRRSDGSWAYVLTRRVVHRDEAGQPIEFLGVALDVTAQVDKVREASERAKRLEVAVSAAGLGVWSREPGQERAQWNDEMFRMTGRPRELGGPTREEWIRDIVHPEDRAMMTAAGNAPLTPETAVSEHQCRIVKPDGEVRWLVNRVRREPSGGSWLSYGVTLDVTDRVLAEAALRRANERVALAARSVGMGTWEWNVDTGEAVWDDAMFRLRGMEPRARALDAAERLAMTHPDDVENVRQSLREAADNTGTTAYEFRVVWPNGSVRWIASRSTPLPDESGRRNRRIGVNWDVTEARTAEINRAERELALRESKAKSEFLSRMSHELRTPLNAVLGFAQLLQIEAPSLPAHQRAKIDHIRSAGEHLLSLIDDVLDLSSLESDQLRLEHQPVPLAEVVKEALPLVEAMAREQHVGLNVRSLDGVAWGDRTRLRQVAINLLTNAIKYNRPQGRVTVSAEARGAEVLLRVEDSGRGMTQDQLAHLFEPFNRLGIESEGIAGTGIGLAVVKALVERMQGRIAVTSEPRVGSVFEVHLRRAAEAEPVIPEAAPSVVGMALHEAPPRATLLYIEDNPVNVLLVQELVGMRPGLALQSADTGQAGVARAVQLAPDLILVDIQLPDIDGFEVLQRLRQQERTARIPCIALSANAMPQDIARAKAAGFADYWTKPIDFKVFLAALDERFKPG